MPVYVDIDLDYLVKPIKKESVNNVRLYKNEECSIDDINTFIDKLKDRGLVETSDKKFFLNHRKSYTYWWIKKSKNNTLIHIDAHSDMYRNKNRNLTLLRDTDMGCDDYIWYAIRDSFVSEVYWVIPDNSYNLCSEEFINRTLPRDMLVTYEYAGGMLHAVLRVITREGERDIKYIITHLDNLPSFDNVEMLTVATSPEFVPEAADNGFSLALEKLGASEVERARIMKMHSDMPEGAPSRDPFIPDNNAS